MMFSPRSSGSSLGSTSSGEKIQDQENEIKLLRAQLAASMARTSFQSLPASLDYASRPDDDEDLYKPDFSCSRPSTLDSLPPFPKSCSRHSTLDSLPAFPKDSCSRPSSRHSTLDSFPAFLKDSCSRPSTPDSLPAFPQGDVPIDDDEEEWMWASDSRATSKQSRVVSISSLVEVQEFDNSQIKLEKLRKMCTTFARRARTGRRCALVGTDMKLRPAMYFLDKEIKTLLFRDCVMAAPFLKCDLCSIQEVVAEEDSIVRIVFKKGQTGSQAVRFAEASIKERDFCVKALGALTAAVKKQI